MRLLVSSMRRVTLWLSAPAAPWTDSASIVTGDCILYMFFCLFCYWQTRFYPIYPPPKKIYITHKQDYACNMALSLFKQWWLNSEVNDNISPSLLNQLLTFAGWSRMNVSVHVSALWRSMSVQATSPMLKTGQSHQQTSLTSTREKTSCVKAEQWRSRRECNNHAGVQ